MFVNDLQKMHFNFSTHGPLFYGCVLVSSIILVLNIERVRKRILYLPNLILSTVIGAYLEHVYSIRHTESGARIPTAPYVFPNGHGNVAKFLEGFSNSNLWGSRYGSIYRIWAGTKPEIVLTRPEHIKTVFKDSDRHVKALNNNSGYFMQQLLGKCLGLISGQEWAAVKKVVSPPFLHSSMHDHVDLVADSVRQYMEDVYAEKAANNKDVDLTLDAIEDVKMLPFFILARILYGKLTTEMETELRDLAKERESLFHYVIQGGLTRFGLSRLLSTKANRELAAFRRRWESFNDIAARSWLGSERPPPITSMYGMSECGEFSKDHLLQTIDEILFANLDVTMGAVGWALVFLAAHPELQNKLRTELREWQKDEGRVEDSMRRYMLSTSTLLHASILEAARLKPLAAFSVPQAAPTDRLIDGYLVPGGTDFVIDSFGLNLNANFWGKDANTFRPERFLEKDLTELRYNYWRFGFGPRQCLGKYIADLMLHSLVARMVQDYDLANDCPEEEWKRIEETWISHPKVMLRWKQR